MGVSPVINQLRLHLFDRRWAVYETEINSARTLQPNEILLARIYGTSRSQPGVLDCCLTKQFKTTAISSSVRLVLYALKRS